MMQLKLPKLPQSKQGMRRIWDMNTRKWKYTPVTFPESYNKSLEWLIWNEEADTWEIINKKSGKLIIIDNNNYVEDNLRMRSYCMGNI